MQKNKNHGDYSAQQYSSTGTLPNLVLTYGPVKKLVGQMLRTQEITSNNKGIKQMSTQYFVGIDLAWHNNRNPSGVAVIEMANNRANLSYASSNFRSHRDILDFLNTIDSCNVVIAIDAPLIITNEIGQRPCETEIGKKFGEFDASAHSSNRTLFPNPASMQLVQQLGLLGYSHNVDPNNDTKRNGKWIFEVYPHPAQVVLFELSKIIKYKRGTVQDRKNGLATLRQNIIKLFPLGLPSITINPESNLFIDINGLKGKRIKAYEDTLDAIVCAYLAYHYWEYGYLRNEMIGSMQQGYIINPTKKLNGE